MKKVIVLVLLALLIAGSLSVSAQDEMGPPSVEVVDQLVLDGTVWIDSAYSEGPGFVVIHTDNGSGGPGPVVGYRWVNPGWNYNIEIEINAAGATPLLFAMLHTDTGEVGVYEFGTVEGADGPVSVDGSVVTPSFNVNIINAHDQFVAEDGSVTIASVTSQVPGWLVVHNGDEETFGPVAGATFVEAGTTTDVVVTLEAPTPVLWPMLHVDTGEAGTYEFGTVEGADGPVVLDGEVATLPIATFPSMEVYDQIVLYGDGQDAGDMVPTVHAHSVLSEGPGWLVIHSDNEGAPGPVLGATAVQDGLNLEVNVELSGDITPVVWPMLHVDTGEVGAYEFGTVEGADGPVRVNDEVLTYAISIAPSFGNFLCEFTEGLVLCDALIDAPGWLVIHDNNNGAPGPVLGTFPLLPGWNYAEIEIETASTTVFPMLHYDTGTAGVYEFGSVEGADAPTSFGGSVVVGPIDLITE